MPRPLTATQILWLNLVTDGATGISLATESSHGNIMKTRPLMKNDNILNKEVIPFLFINVGLIVGISLTVFYYYISDSLEKARTGVFIVMAFTQLFNVYNLRNIHMSVFEIGLFSNKYINIAVGVSILLLILITEVPILVMLFYFKSINIIELTILFGISSMVLWAGESYKLLNSDSKKTS